MIPYLFIPVSLQCPAHVAHLLLRETTFQKNDNWARSQETQTGMDNVVRKEPAFPLLSEHMKARRSTFAGFRGRYPSLRIISGSSPENASRWQSWAGEDGLCLAKGPQSYCSSCSSSRRRFQGLASGFTLWTTKESFTMWASLDSDTSSATPCSKIHYNENDVMENAESPGPICREYS